MTDFGEHNKIKVYLAVEDQQFLDTLGKSLQQEHVYGMVTPGGSVNRSGVVRWLIDQERQRRDLQGIEALR